MSYNGWTNRPTWLVKLHLDNTRQWQEQMHAFAAVHSGEDDSFLLTETIRQWVELKFDQWFRRWPQTDTSRFMSDMLTDALSEVNWKEIAEHYLTEIR